MIQVAWLRSGITDAASGSFPSEARWRIIRQLQRVGKECEQ
jgi:hypothetical protein